jgi:hypothetical protein
MVQELVAGSSAVAFDGWQNTRVWPTLDVIGELGHLDAVVRLIQMCRIKVGKTISNQKEMDG